MLEQGDLFPMSLDHSFQTLGKPQVATQKISKSGFFKNDKKEQILADCRAEIHKHEFQADYERRNIKKIEWSYRAPRGDEQHRRDQQLLHEQLLDQNRELCEALEKTLNEVEEMKRFQGSAFDTISRRRRFI